MTNKYSQVWPYQYLNLKSFGLKYFSNSFLLSAYLIFAWQILQLPFKRLVVQDWQREMFFGICKQSDFWYSKPIEKSVTLAHTTPWNILLWGYNKRKRVYKHWCNKIFGHFGEGIQWSLPFLFLIGPCISLNACISVCILLLNTPSFWKWMQCCSSRFEKKCYYMWESNPSDPWFSLHVKLRENMLSCLGIKPKWFIIHDMHLDPYFNS